MSSAEDGYCSSDSPRAESPDEPLLPAAGAGADADAESPRAGAAGLNKRERDLPASPSSPLPPAKRRYGRDSCVASHHACLRREYRVLVFCAVRARDLLQKIADLALVSFCASKQPEIGGEAGCVRAAGRVRGPAQRGHRGGAAAVGLVGVAQVWAEAHQGLPLPTVRM
jgi:hypothetical protein